MRTHSLGQALSLLVLIFTALPGGRHLRMDATNSNAAKPAFTLVQETAALSKQNSFELGRELGPRLEGMLPDNWSVSYGPNSLSLTRDQKVFIYSSANWPAFHQETLDEMVRRFGEEIVYRVTLRFVGRLTQAEYAALKKEWKACEIENKPGSTFSIEKWLRAQECYRAKQPPVYYSKRYSVYVDRPDWWSALEIYPQTAADEAKKVHGAIDKLLYRYDRVSSKARMRT